MDAVRKQGLSYVKAVQKKALARPKAAPDLDGMMPLMITFERNLPALSILFQIIGSGLVIGSAAMWVLPGSTTAADLVLMKFGASVFMLFFGLAILMLSHSDNQPDAYFDPIRREVRVLQRSENGRPQTVLRRSFDSLGSARFSEKTLELYDMDGSVLMRLKIQSPEVRHALRLQLCNCVHIST